MDLSTYVPQVINQIINYPTHYIITNEEYNDILNLLISQGDSAAEALAQIVTELLQAESDIVGKVSSENITAIKYSDGNIQVTVDGVAWLPVGSTLEVTLVPHTHGNISADGKLLDDTSTPIANAILGTDEDGNIVEATPASTATPSTLMKRDANGRAQVTNPVADGDITNKGYVDTAIDTVVDTAVSDAKKESLVRDLNIMLMQSLSFSNIDSWVDVFINANMTNNHVNLGITGGTLNTLTTTLVTAGAGDTDQAFGTTAIHKVRQSFLATDSGVLTTLTQVISKNGSPSDSVVAKIYASDQITLLATSDPIIGSDLTTGLDTQYLSFSTPLVLVQGATYFIEYSRTGSLNSSNYYTLRRTSTSTMSNGYLSTYNGTTWTTTTYDVGVAIMYCKNGSMNWNMVNSTEPFSVVAVTEDRVVQADLDGTTIYYMSDDAITWVEVPVNTPVDVTFVGTNVYLKIETVGPVQLNAVAWGGY